MIEKNKKIYQMNLYVLKYRCTDLFLSIKLIPDISGYTQILSLLLPLRCGE